MDDKKIVNFKPANKQSIPYKIGYWFMGILVVMVASGTLIATGLGFTKLILWLIWLLR